MDSHEVMLLTATSPAKGAATVLHAYRKGWLVPGYASAGGCRSCLCTGAGGCRSCLCTVAKANHLPDHLPNHLPDH